MGGFLKAPKPPPPPVVEPPAPMADPEDPKLKLTARRDAARKIAMSGRQSTLISDNTTDTLG
jgi:hypothetical protein